MSELKILLLGRPHVEMNRTVVEIRRRKVLALLAFLGITERPPTRDELAALFYPRMDRERAYAGIRQTLSYLKDVIGDGWLETGLRSVSLRRGDGLSVDVLEFLALLERARGAKAMETLQKAVGLYRDRFLAGFYLKDCPSFESWQSAKEQELRERYAAALARLADLREERGEIEAAVEMARSLVGLDPLEEEPQRRLMRLLAHAGRAQAALRQYESLRKALAGEIEEEPDEETTALRDAIRAGKVARLVPVDAAPERAPDTVVHSPQPPSGFVAFAFADIPTAARDQAAARNLANAARSLEAAGGTVFSRGRTEVRAAFADASEAVAAALRTQILARAGFASGGRTAGRGAVGMRAAVHAGEAERIDGAYTGRAAERAGFLLRAAHEGQVLVSGPAAERSSERLPAGSELRPLGTHRLEDLGPPLSIFRLAHPDLPSRFPAIRTLETRPGNLRGQPTFLVGRDTEMIAVTDLLGSDGVWLLTLTGPGGIGKTRLALHAAARLSGSFPQGAWFVDLAAVHRHEQVASAIASSLGIRETPGAARPPAELLKDYLRSRQLLLVLDNFEHVLEAAVEVGGITAACPGLKILATSREPLHLQGERELPIPPLQLPGSGSAAMAGCESVRLFLERAHAVHPDLRADDRTMTAIGEICEKLDGLPLAIELAAARTKVLAPRELLDRLSKPMQVLTRGAVDVPERQRTLRREVCWSYDLLEEGEKELFRRIAIFPGGCTLEAAESVCAAGPGRDGPETLDRLSALVDKNLLRRQDEAGSVRFRMLHIIREFALEALARSGEAAAVAERFARFEGDLAERAAPMLLGPQQADWLARLDGEADNLSAALAWQEEERRVESGVRLSGALGWYWFRRGQFSSGARWLERFLALSDESIPAAPRARSFHYLGWMRLMLGTTFYGNPGALDCFRKCLPLWKAAGDGRGEAQCLAWLGWCEVDKSAPERYALADRGVAAARATGDPWTISFCLKLANSYMVREDKAGADRIAALEESIVFARRAGDPFLVCQAVHGMGDVFMFLRDDVSAEPWYRESIALAKEIGDSWSTLDTQTHLGWGFVNRGDLDRATECFADALRAAAAAGARSYVGQFLAGFAGIARRRGDPVRALRLGGAVSALQAFGQEVRNPELVEGTGLPAAAVEREWNGGRAMGMDEAIRFALGEAGPVR